MCAANTNGQKPKPKRGRKRASVCIQDHDKRPIRVGRDKAADLVATGVYHYVSRTAWRKQTRDAGKRLSVRGG